jgi:hypothetical protein
MLTAAEEVVSQKTNVQRLIEEESYRPFVKGPGLSSEPWIAVPSKRDGGYLNEQNNEVEVQGSEALEESTC